ncbi:hypothetical protein C8R44DRAFT_821145 [Mycena epipterygia]|nr:hypothetical protein C8R44DRAFT_821145 [Mycena epipterygia]
MSTIHPSLLVRNTSRLRSSLRPVALAAVNGSSKDLAKLCVVLNSLPEDQAVGLLPVLYVHLDPSSIPDPDVLDTIIATSTRLPCIDNASKSLYSLSTMARKRLFPLDAVPFLWARVSKWVFFLATYWDHLPGFNAAEQPIMRVAYCAILLRLKEHQQTSVVMSATRGVRRMYAASWATMVHYNGIPDPNAPQASLAELTIPLLALSNRMDDMKDINNFEEVVDACGGSYRDLAMVLTKHLSLATADSKSQMAVGALTSALMFLQPTHGIHDDFTSVLLSHGIISSLVSALDIDRMAPPVIGLPHKPVDLCLALLIEYIKTSPRFTWIAEALRAGLLRYVISFSENIVEESQRGMYSDLQDLLSTVLPSGLVSYTVVSQMKRYFSEIETVSQSAKFSRSALFEDWSVFKTLVEERVKVFDAWESAGMPSFLACDNMKCTKIGKKEDFKSCSACRSASYCSPQCQRVDWLDIHRNICDTLQSTRVDCHDNALNTRERAFLRALLHADYQRLRFKTLIRVLIFMHHQPDEPFFVLFDYTLASGVEIGVRPKAELQPTDYVEAQWDRLARAGGRMTLHVMVFGLQQLSHRLMFPLRATSPTLHDGMRRISHNMNVLQPAQVEALLHVLIQTADKEGMEIH